MSNCCPYEEEKKECEKDNDGFLDTKIIVDRQNKLQLVLDNVAANCRPDSEHTDIQYFYEALQAGDRLQGKVIAGGLTNYSYQLYLESDPSKRLFAKACFGYALWCPGEKHYDLGRQHCEFNLMQEFSKVLSTADENGDSSSPVVTPYLLFDIPNENMRVLVSEWATADEQWANQFIEGEVDRRVLHKVGTALAKISLHEVKDKDLNQEMLADLRAMMAEFDGLLDTLFDPSKPQDECLNYLNSKEFGGKDRLKALQERQGELENRKDCLIHGDTHVFNMLVEAKLDTEKLQQFGEKGNFVLCDWEMAHVSCYGQDLGILFYVPIACAYFHAARGFVDKAQEILGCLDEIWETYEACMVKEGAKDEAFLQDTFLNLVGFCGMRMFLVLYAAKAQLEYIDQDGLAKEEIDAVVASIGLTGIQFEEFAFGSDRESIAMDFAGLRGWYSAKLKQQLASLAELAQKRVVGRRTLRRKSSLLRASGRRVSDASLQDFLSLASVDFAADL